MVRKSLYDLGSSSSELSDEMIRKSLYDLRYDTKDTSVKKSIFYTL